jgi:hypothetical protein
MTSRSDSTVDARRTWTHGCDTAVTAVGAKTVAVAGQVQAVTRGAPNHPAVTVRPEWYYLEDSLRDH